LQMANEQRRSHAAHGARKFRALQCRIVAPNAAGSELSLPQR